MSARRSRNLPGIEPSRRGFLLAIAVAAGPAAAQPQDAQAHLRLQSLAATCAQCHGTDGRAAAGSAVPGLAGRAADETLAAMTAFKNGSRPSTVMGQLAAGYSEAQIRQLATYFAALAP